MTKRQLIKLLELMKDRAVQKVEAERDETINTVIKDHAVAKHVEKDIKEISELLRKAIMILNLTHKKIGLKDRNWGSPATSKIKNMLENMNDPSDYIKANMNVDPLTSPVIMSYDARKKDVLNTYNILIQNVTSFPKIVDAMNYLKDMGFDIPEAEKAENLPILPLNQNLLIYKGGETDGN